MKKSTILAALMVSIMSTGSVAPAFAETKLSAEENASEVELVKDEATETEVSESELQKEVIVTTDDVDKLNELTEEADAVEEITEGTYIVTYNSEEEAVKAEQETFAEEDVIETEENQLFEISENSDDETDKTIQKIAEEKADESEKKNVTPSNDITDSSNTDFTDCPYRQKAEEDGKVLIAVIDTGVDPQLVIHSENFTTEESVDDVNGHGTDVTKKILEHADGKAYIVSLKAMNDKGTGYMSSIMKAIQWAIDQKVDIINLSIAAPDRGTAVSLSQLVTTAIDNGIKVVASAGNYNSSAKLFLPGSIEGVISVGAMDEDHNKIESSNYAADYYEVADSTSMAAGILTGKIAGGYDLEDEVTDSMLTYKIENLINGILTCKGKNEYVKGETIFVDVPVFINISYNALDYIKNNSDCKKILITATDISSVIDEFITKAMYDSTYSSYIYTFDNEEECLKAFNKVIRDSLYYGMICCTDITDIQNAAFKLNVTLHREKGLQNGKAELVSADNSSMIAMGKNIYSRFETDKFPSSNSVYGYIHIVKPENGTEYTDIESLSEIVRSLNLKISDTNLKTDNENPVFTKSVGVIIVEEGDLDFDVCTLFQAVDNSGKVTIKSSEYDPYKLGTQEIEVRAIDGHNNITSIKVELRIISSEIVAELNEGAKNANTLDVVPDTQHFEDDGNVYGIPIENFDELFEVQSESGYIPPAPESIPENRLGNSKKAFATLKEAMDWANAQSGDPKSQWYGMVPIYHNVCLGAIAHKNDPVTVNFN